jgi:hypothetical protein
MSESRIAYQTNGTPAAVAPAERIRPIAEWLEAHVAPLMADGRKARVLLHLRGNEPPLIELTLIDYIR